MSQSHIVVRGARAHNLKSIDVDIPRETLTVITGPSGSGKSSLAFDTIYAEGQRRYVESLSPFARQFLDRLPRPDLDFIDGLSPTLSVTQGPPSRNPRSTVGTVTEIHDHLRLLYARAGTPHCPHCGKRLESWSVQAVVDRVLALPEGTRFSVLAPILRASTEDVAPVLAALRKDGFVRVRVDGEVHDLGDDVALRKKRTHDVDVFVDRLSVKGASRQRLTEAVELAYGRSPGLVRIAIADGEELLLSERARCLEHDFTFPEIEPRLFSFNSPEGACPRCGGIGEIRQFDPELVVPDASVSLADGAVRAWGTAKGVFYRHNLDVLTRSLDVDVEAPFSSLPRTVRAHVMEGTPGGYEGVLPGLARRLATLERKKREEGASEENAFEEIEEELGPYWRERTCPECGGARLSQAARAVRVGGHDIVALTRMTLPESRAVIASLALEGRSAVIARRISAEIESRIGFLVDVGLAYLTLDRATATLSGGEAQRIRLATQLGAGLTGVLYVLDEPSVGLHPRDIGRLVETLVGLRERGNTLLVVEHDPDMIRAADHVVDIGPGAGRLGGRVVATGSVADIERSEGSSTGAFLSGRRAIGRSGRRKVGKKRVRVTNATLHNLQNVDVAIPTGALVAVTGPSGSGKSSLVMDTLVVAARAHFAGQRPDTEHGTVSGLDAFESLVVIDQDPIGRTPRSNPASYTGILSELRTVFSQLPEARARGYKPGRFSFNVKGGRCDACEGEGVIRVDMHFLPDLFVTCETCGGARYNRETLEVRYRGLSIADVLDQTVDDALELFAALPKVRRGLEALHGVGLGYIPLGQAANTLSGGEAQRVKLARELARRPKGRVLYVLDEPTTGLHFVDVELLLAVLDTLVDAGHTVVVVEHDLDVVKVADYVVDLGPGGGDEGGRVVAEGTPEAIAKSNESATGPYLAARLAERRPRAK